MNNDKEKAWEDKVEALIIEGLRAIENAEGDPLAAFRKKVANEVVKIDQVEVSEADYILAQIGAC